MAGERDFAPLSEDDVAISPERQAFDDGRLYLLVKEHPRYDTRAWGGHVRAAAFITHSEPFATVHVMSRPAGGEIRGYVRLGGLLYLRLPNYTGEWDALDFEVSLQLGCPVVTKEPVREVCDVK